MVVGRWLTHTGSRSHGRGSFRDLHRIQGVAAHSGGCRLVVPQVAGTVHPMPFRQLGSSVTGQQPPCMNESYSPFASLPSLFSRRSRLPDTSIHIPGALILPLTTCGWMSSVNTSPICLPNPHSSRQDFWTYCFGGPQHGHPRTGGCTGPIFGGRFS